VVVDTDVYSARFVPNSQLALRYEPLLVGRPEVLSFQTVAEVRYGALLRGWGEARLRRLDVAISRAEVVPADPTSSVSIQSSVSPVNGSATRCASASMTLIAGLRRLHSAWASRLCRTTASSTERRDSCSKPSGRST
jgi:hypothetical protein